MTGTLDLTWGGGNAAGGLGDEWLAFDLETTGVDRQHDVPVSYAFISFVAGKVVAKDVGIIDPGRDIPEGATAIHGITTDMARSQGMPLDEAVEMIAGRLLSAGSGGIPVVGMNLTFDLTMVDAQCRRLGGSLGDRGFNGVVLDVLVLDRHVDKYRKGRRTLVDLCSHYNVVFEHAHDAAADAEGTVQVLAEILRRYPEIGGLGAEGLHRAQAEWHKEWATSYDEWRRGKGMTPLDSSDFDWPISSGS